MKYKFQFHGVSCIHAIKINTEESEYGKYFFFNVMLFSFSVPASFRDKANPNFTIKRMYDSAREEFEQLERLREVSYVAAS